MSVIYLYNCFCLAARINTRSSSDYDLNVNNRILLNFLYSNFPKSKYAIFRSRSRATIFFSQQLTTNQWRARQDSNNRRRFSQLTEQLLLVIPHELWNIQLVGLAEIARSLLGKGGNGTSDMQEQGTNAFQVLVRKLQRRSQVRLRGKWNDSIKMDFVETWFWCEKLITDVKSTVSTSTYVIKAWCQSTGMGQICSHYERSWKYVMYTYRSQDSAVSIAAGYGVDDRGVVVLVLVAPRMFTSPRRLLSIGYRRLCHRG
jgi:hypothetical protein